MAAALWACAAVLVGLPKEAFVSLLVVEERSLPEVVREAPIIVIARLAQPEPEVRSIEVTAANADGDTVRFGFQGEIWRFAVIEVLKAEGAPLPQGTIEVVGAGLERDYVTTYKYEVEGVSVSPIQRRKATAYLRDVHDLGARDAILFLAPPPDAQAGDDPYRSAFGRAYSFTVWPGLDDPALRTRILNLVGANAE